MTGPFVRRYLCPVRPGERPEIEQHVRNTVSLVRRGSFCYRLGRRAHAFGPGAVLLGNAGVEYMVTHEYGCGDECLIFEWDELPTEVRPFDRPMLPPLPRLEALARVTLDAIAGVSDVGADEAGWALLAAVDGELAQERGKGRGASQRPAGGPRDRDRAIAAAN